MFQRILQFLRGVIDKMINTSGVKGAFHVDVALSPYMINALALWSEMYAGRAYWLNQAQEGATLRGEAVRKMRSLNLPSAIAGEIARMVTIEMGVEISGSPRADFLMAQMEPIIDQMRKQVEYGAAKGGLMMKPYVNDNGGISVDFIQADQFYPIAYDSSGNITSVVFADQRRIGNVYFTRLEYHAMLPDGNGCQIINAAYRSNSLGDLGVKINLSDVPVWSNIEPEATVTNIDRPLYGYFKFPMANHIDPSSPLGVSCYSKVVELIENADTQWSDLMWEFESGKRALYVDALAFEKGKDGLPMLPNKRLYRTLETNANDKNFFEDWSPTFREQSLITGMNAILKKIEFNCGFAYGTLSDPEDIERTATEIKIGRQRSYIMVTDTQKSLRKALEDTMYAINAWVSIAGLAPEGDYQAVYNFSDSIVTDIDSQIAQDLQVVGANIMSKYEFRMRNYGETEAIAKKKVAEALKDNTGNSLLTDLFNISSNASSTESGGTAPSQESA